MLVVACGRLAIYQSGASRQYAACRDDNFSEPRLRACAAPALRRERKHKTETFIGDMPKMKWQSNAGSCRGQNTAQRSKYCVENMARIHGIRRGFIRAATRMNRGYATKSQPMLRAARVK